MKKKIQAVRLGFNDLTTRILGPNSLVQGAVPELLENTPQSYFDGIMEYLSVRKFSTSIKAKILSLLNFHIKKDKRRDRIQQAK